MTTNENIMKPIKFKATTHSCSVCCYRSLIKTPISNHVKSKKCEGAKIVTEEKIVSHTDEHDSEVFKATLYQCVKCSYTTYQGAKMNTHVSKRCVGADVISSKRVLCFDDVPKTDHINNVTATQGDNSVAAGIIDHSFNTINNINIYLPPGSVEEYAALVNMLCPLIDRGMLKLSGDLSAIPAEISAIARSSDQKFDNKHVTHNDVVNRVDGTVIPKGKHSKQEISRYMSALYDALKCKIDPYIPDDILDRDEILDVRKSLLHIFFKEPALDDIKNDEGFDDDYLCAVPGYTFSPDTDFYLGCRYLVEDPFKFKHMPLDVQKKVRLAAKTYLNSLPIETKTRPNACIAE